MSCKNSVLALRELRKQCFGVARVAKTVFLCCVSCENSVLGLHELQNQCFGVA